MPAATYRGKSADVKLDIAIGHSGALEIELIQWVSGESPHREFIERGREGMHHVQYRVENADQLDRSASRRSATGRSGTSSWCADTTFAYLERSGDPLIVEFLEMPPGGPGTRLPG